MVALTRTVPRKHALEMLLTGDMLSAAEATRIGLINQNVELAQLESTTIKLTEKIAAKSSFTVSLGKAAFYRQIEMTTEEAYQFACKTMVDNLLADDAQEGISAFFAKT